MLGQDKIMKAEGGEKKSCVFSIFLSSAVKCQSLQMPGSKYEKVNFGEANEAFCA